MKYEKAVVTMIDLGEDQIISTSGGISDECDTTASKWMDNCNNTNHKTKPCTNPAHKG